MVEKGKVLKLVEAILNVKVVVRGTSLASKVVSCWSIFNGINSWIASYIGICEFLSLLSHYCKVPYAHICFDERTLKNSKQLTLYAHIRVTLKPKPPPHTFALNIHLNPSVKLFQFTGKNFLQQYFSIYLFNQSTCTLSTTFSLSLSLVWFSRRIWKK